MSDLIFSKALKAIQKETYLPKVIKLLDDLGDMNYQSHDHPVSLLMEAAKDGRIGLLQYLVEHGADLDAHKERGSSSPLHQAAYYCHLDCVNYLLDLGADVNYVNMVGQTALTFVADNHEFKKDRFQVVTRLLDAGANINHQESISGQTTLTKILQKTSYDFEVVRLLVSRGADPTIKSKEMGDAFHIARLFKRDDALELMMEYQKAKEENALLDGVIEKSDKKYEVDVVQF